MKILIDIGHPAHVHYFKNFIKIMENKGHKFCVISRDKEVTQKLLDSLRISYINRGKGKNTIIGKAFYLIKANFIILFAALKFKPDIFLSFVSPYAAQVSFLLKKPHIAFDDTEHAILGQLLYLPFTNVVFTPNRFKKNFGKKQILFDGTMDICYLSKKYFSPDSSILTKLGIAEEQDYILLRFVSWHANHDIGQHGLEDEGKSKIITELSKTCKVIISSEDELPEAFEKYKIKLEPHEIHSALYFAKLYIGESTTMATESATLGTPAVCVNSSVKYFGVFEAFIENDLIFPILDVDKIIELSNKLLMQDKTKFIEKSMLLLSNKIDVTAFMVWFVENYPTSFVVIKKDNNYQYNFNL